MSGTKCYTVRDVEAARRAAARRAAEAAFEAAQMARAVADADDVARSLGVVEQLLHQAPAVNRARDAAAALRRARAGNAASLRTASARAQEELAALHQLHHVHQLLDSLPSGFDQADVVDAATAAREGLRRTLADRTLDAATIGTFADLATLARASCLNATGLAGPPRTSLLQQLREIAHDETARQVVRIHAATDINARHRQWALAEDYLHALDSAATLSVPLTASAERLRERLRVWWSGNRDPVEGTRLLNGSGVSLDAIRLANAHHLSAATACLTCVRTDGDLSEAAAEWRASLPGDIDAALEKLRRGVLPADLAAILAEIDAISLAEARQRASLIRAAAEAEGYRWHDVADGPARVVRGHLHDADGLAFVVQEQAPTWAELATMEGATWVHGPEGANATACSRMGLHDVTQRLGIIGVDATLCGADGAVVATSRGAASPASSPSRGRLAP